jgi:antitoxin VapB
MPGQRHVRLFRKGRNQVVRIPVEFELPGDEAIMYRDVHRLVIKRASRTRPRRVACDDETSR